MPVLQQLTVDASLSQLLPVGEMGLREAEILRLILRGGSVVDWRRLNFESHAEVDRFLRLHQLEPSDPIDRATLGDILDQAVEYLRSTFDYRVAEAVAHPKDIRDLFLFASGKGEAKWRRIACIVLKVMHVIHHIEGRELRFQSRVAEAEIARLVDERVSERLRDMQRLGFPIVEFSGNVKTRHSLVTKLLAKRETLAAQVFDKVRYRIVTENRRDVVPVLNHLQETLVPFNLVVPGQTENSLVSFRRLMLMNPNLKALVKSLQMDLRLEASDQREQRKVLKGKKGNNQFSGRSYRVLNFVVDLPLRIDRYLPAEELAKPLARRIVFALVEFQLFDRQTARHNELGENSHDRYKHRQKLMVLKRLSRGLVVPRRDRGG